MVNKSLSVCILQEIEVSANDNNKLSSLLINAKDVKTAYTQR